VNIRTGLGALAVVAGTAAPAGAGEILVFAAVSLADAVQAIGRDFETAHGHHTAFSFAGSNVLAMQIRAGARADVLLSADEDIMDGLANAGLVRPGTRRSLLSNRLVLVTRADRPLVARSAADLQGIGRIAIAEPQTVPAGKYAKAYLQHLDTWTALAAQLVPTENVRAALAAVESGNVDAAFVYRTDAAIGRRVRVVFEVPAADTPRISYPVAGLRDGRSPVVADAFLTYLRTRAAAAVFERFGFVVLPE
jgi:molybdate transport system substrate-binding protein